MTAVTPTPAPSPSIAGVLQSLVLPVYLPVFLINMGTAVLIPVLPLYLDDLGLSASTIGTVVAAAGLGGFISQIAIGRALARRSETTVMVCAILVVSVSVALMGAVVSALTLAALRVASGIGSAGWVLSRQSFITRTVHATNRGRAMSGFGGVTRLAFFIGPLLGGTVAETVGFRAALLTSAAASACGLVPLLVWHVRSVTDVSPPSVMSALDSSPVNASPSGDGGASARSLLRGHERVLALAGVGQLLIMAVRQGRFLVLPLVGVAVGLDAGDVGALVAIGGFIDLVMFPLAGYLMDRFGRLAAVIPAFSGLALGLFLLGVVSTPVGVTMAAIVMGLGNGIGSGTMLTISSDLAPPTSPGLFLGVLGTIRDAGRIAGPLVVGGLADYAGLGPASIVLGVVALAGLAVLAVGLGETRHLNPATSTE